MYIIHIRLGIIFIRSRVTFSANSILKHWVHDQNCKLCEIFNEVILIGSLGRFPWKKTILEGFTV